MSTTSDPILLGPVTLAFPSLFQPSTAPNSQAEPKYNTGLIIPKAMYLEKVRPVIDAMVAQEFKNNESLMPDFKWGFLDCAVKPNTYPAELTADMMYGNAKSQFPVDVIGADRQKIINPGTIKDGAQVYIEIHLYTFSATGKGVGIGLGPVMYIGDGQALNTAGGRSAEDAFAGVQVNTDTLAAPISSGAPTAPTSNAPPGGLPPAPPIPGS